MAMQQPIPQAPMAMPEVPAWSFMQGGAIAMPQAQASLAPPAPQGPTLAEAELEDFTDCDMTDDLPLVTDGDQVATTLDDLVRARACMPRRAAPQPTPNSHLK